MADHAFLCFICLSAISCLLIFITLAKIRSHFTTNLCRKLVNSNQCFCTVLGFHLLCCWSPQHLQAFIFIFKVNLVSFSFHRIIHGGHITDVKDCFCLYYILFIITKSWFLQLPQICSVMKWTLMHSWNLKCVCSFKMVQTLFYFLGLIWIRKQLYLIRFCYISLYYCSHWKYIYRPSLFDFVHFKA